MNLQKKSCLADRAAVHMLFLLPPKRDDPEVSGLLTREFAKIKARILNNDSKTMSLAKQYCIEDIWFGQRIAPHKQDVLDKRTKGRLELGNHDPTAFVITMRSKSAQHLTDFYNDDTHSEIRHLFYKMLSPHIKKVIAGVEKMEISDFRQSAYHLVESEASKYLRRRDFSDGDEIDDITEQEPYPWPTSH